MLKLEKKQIKIITLSIVVVFVLGIVGIAVSQYGTTQAMAAPNPSKVGVVNQQQLVSQHPDLAKANEVMQAEIEKAKTDYAEKSASMNEQAKQEYQMQINQRLSLKEKELITPVLEKVDAAIKQVAEAKGLSVVLDKGNVVYGGQDITDEVIKKFSASK